MSFDYTAAIQRVAPALIAEETTKNPHGALRIKAEVAAAADALTKGDRGGTGTPMIVELLKRVNAARSAYADPLAQAARDIAERSGKAAPAVSPTKITPTYAADFAAAHKIDLNSERAKFAGIAKTEAAFAFRQLTLGQDASISARRALHFSLLAGETPEPDIRMLANDQPPRPSDFG